jgi:WD40 repeat protein
VRVFRFPSVNAHDANDIYCGHASFVTTVRFSHDDKYLFTSGGGDLSVCQWRVTLKEAKDYPEVMREKVMGKKKAREVANQDLW